jgi:hypothetical protein
MHHRVAVRFDCRKRNLALYVLSGAALFYSHYIGVFILIGFFVDWLIASRFQRKHLVPLFATGLLIVVLTAPWLPILLRQRAGTIAVFQSQVIALHNPASLSYGAPPAIPGTIRQAIELDLKAIAVIPGFFPAQSTLLLGLLAIPILAVLVGVFFLILRRDRTSTLFACIVVFTALGIYAIGICATRYLVPLIPPVVLVMSRVLQSWMESSRWRIAAAALAVSILAIYLTGFTRQATILFANPWRQLVATLEPAYRPGDVVLFDILYAQLPFDIVAHQDGFFPTEDGFPETIYQYWDRQPVKIWDSPMLTESNLEATVKRAAAESKTKTVWLVLHEVMYFDPFNRLLERFKQVGEVQQVYYTSPPELRLIRVTLKN